MIDCYLCRMQNVSVTNPVLIFFTAGVGDQTTKRLIRETASPPSQPHIYFFSFVELDAQVLVQSSQNFNT